MVDLEDPAVRAQLAERAYYRAKHDQVAVAAEHDPTGTYFALAWEHLDDESRRPFLAGVEETARALAAAA